MNSKIIFLSLIVLVSVNLNGMDADFKSDQDLFNFLREQNPALPYFIYKNNLKLCKEYPALIEHLRIIKSLSELTNPSVNPDLIRKNDLEKAVYFLNTNRTRLAKYCPRTFSTLMQLTLNQIDLSHNSNQYLTTLQQGVCDELRFQERLIKKQHVNRPIYTLTLPLNLNNTPHENLIGALYTLYKNRNENAALINGTSQKLVSLFDTIAAMHYPFIAPNQNLSTSALKKLGCVKETTGCIKFNQFYNLALLPQDMRDRLAGNPLSITQKEFGEILITDISLACPNNHAMLKAYCPAGVQKAKDFPNLERLVLLNGVCLNCDH